ncbi:MAG: hypothetical protein U5S82_01435 [Gammaproteobacteria bacterium]|nr:hypothetical protein [Gammaproteobacteria bacterium]
MVHSKPVAHPSRDRRPRQSDVALVVVGGLAIAVAATLAGGALFTEQAAARMARNQALVAALELTDLCLFTEARYTRHLTQADLHTPFQDAPYSLDHFPSGSVVGPPPGITAHVRMD